MISFSIASHADQEFSTVINSKRVTFRLWYAGFNDRWSLDVSIDGDPVLHGRRVVTGVDMLAAFDFDLGVLFTASKNSNAAPGRDDLSDGTVKIYHATQGEVDAAISS